MTYVIPGIEFNLEDYDKMDENSSEELFAKKDSRRKKEKKRQHKSAKNKDESTKESFKKMKDELDELRRNEIERSKELEVLKKKIEEKEKEKTPNPVAEKPDYALGFDVDLYLSKGFIESAIWIKNAIAKQMIAKMNEDENKLRFDTLMLSRKSSTYLGYRACARFNRNEECNLGK
jgi:hypothetical protein